MSAITAAEQLFKRKKERKKKKKKKPESNGSPRVTHYSTEKLAEITEIYAYIAFPLVSLPHFLVRLLLCFSNNVVTFECCCCCALLFLRDTPLSDGFNRCNFVVFARYETKFLSFVCQ